MVVSGIFSRVLLNTKLLIRDDAGRSIECHSASATPDETSKFTNGCRSWHLALASTMEVSYVEARTIGREEKKNKTTQNAGFENGEGSGSKEFRSLLTVPRDPNLMNESIRALTLSGFRNCDPMTQDIFIRKPINPNHLPKGCKHCTPHTFEA